jgi:FkbM family methyltransferase
MSADSRVGRFDRATGRLAALLSRAGLGHVNRWGKLAVSALAPRRLTVRTDGLIIKGSTDHWRTLGKIRAGRLEPLETQLFTSRLEPGMVVVDIGANIGYYTLLGARAVGPSDRVYAFESDARSCVFLERNVRANGFNGVTILQKAASSAVGTRELFLSGTAAHSSLARSGIEHELVGTTTVETVRVDDVLDGQIVDVVKMDVEGNEPAVLDGMTETLARNSDITVFLEFRPRSLTAAGVDPRAFALALTTRFRRVLRIDEPSGTLVAFESMANDRHQNLLCAEPVINDRARRAAGTSAKTIPIRQRVASHRP